MNHASVDQQASSLPTTVTQRPLQILPSSRSASLDRTHPENDREEMDINSSPIQFNHHTHSYPHCNSNQSPIPSNANLNNANVPSILALTNGRQQRFLLSRDRPSSAKHRSSASPYSKMHNKPWKSHSTRSVFKKNVLFLLCLSL